MSRRGEQLGLWQQGDESVRVAEVGKALVLTHLMGGKQVAEMTLPASRSFLLALREACDQALRKRGEAA